MIRAVVLNLVGGLGLFTLFGDHFSGGNLVGGEEHPNLKMKRRKGREKQRGNKKVWGQKESGNRLMKWEFQTEGGCSLFIWRDERRLCSVSRSSPFVSYFLFLNSRKIKKIKLFIRKNKIAIEVF